MPQASYEIGDEVVLISGNGVPERLDGWRAVVMGFSGTGKLDITTGNERRLVPVSQVKPNE